MFTPETLITINSDHVEFRTPTTFGSQVVKVYTTILIPRVVMFSEWIVEESRHREPMALPLDEIIEFTRKAFDLAGIEFPSASSLKL